MANVNLIRTYREQVGLSQEEVGNQIGVARQTVATWEKGQRTPSLAQLARIAKVLRVSIELLLSHPAQLDDSVQLESSLLFRADEPSALNPFLRAHLIQKVADYTAVESLLGELPLLPETRPLERYDEYTVTLVARDVRNWLGLGAFCPLGDVLALLDSKGLKIILYPLPKEVSGFSAYTESWGGVIFINEIHPTERQFFTALHELAHLIFHRQEYRQPKNLPRRNNPREKAANQLAGATLVPDEVIEQELHAYQNCWLPEPLLIDIKRRYGVSMRTVLYRAAQAGVITKHQMGQQIGKLNEKHGRENEPGELPRPFRLNRLERLVYLALIKEKLTTSRAAEILGENLVDIRHALTQWTGEDQA